jgi:hypothetical protein
MLCYLEQVQDAPKSRLARQFRSDVRKPNHLNRIYFDRAFVHLISPTYPDMRAHPEPHAARNFSPSHSFTQLLRKRHPASLACQLRRSATMLFKRLRPGIDRCPQKSPSAAARRSPLRSYPIIRPAAFQKASETRETAVQLHFTSSDFYLCCFLTSPCSSLCTPFRHLRAPLVPRHCARKTYLRLQLFSTTFTVLPASFPITRRISALTGSICLPSPMAMNELLNG